MSDTVWLAIIGIIAMIVKDYLDRRRAEDTEKKIDTKVDDVKKTVEIVTAQQNTKLNDLAGQVEQVHVATNSMKDALVLATEKEALARGIKEGTETQQEKNRQSCQT